MDQTEERIIEEVRTYDHLYNFSSSDYKDSQMTFNSWGEIAQNTRLEAAECTKSWKNLRDKYVRLRKKLATKSGRETDSNYESTTSCGSSESETASTSTSPSPTEPPRSVTPGLLATRPPASSPVESPVSRPKRKRNQQDDVLGKQMGNLDERKMELHQKLLHEEDECFRFGQTVGDLLRRVPDDQRPALMFKVYGLIHEHGQ